MTLLSKLERRFGWMAVPNITLFIVFAQVCGFLLIMARPGSDTDPTSSMLFRMVLVPDFVLHGEVWRLFSFLLIPSTTSVLFIFFELYFLYFMGTALEANWGAFRYNVYLLIAYLMTIAAAFVQPEMPATNAFMIGSVFLAFAFLFPEFVIYLFLVLPIKVKWVAWLTWAFYIYQFAVGSLQTKALVVASTLNFLLFFGKDIVQHAKTGHRRLKTKVEKVQQRDSAFHTCAVCGITDKTHPKMDFRYCPLCVGSWGYCSEHLLHHEHKTQPPGE